MKNRQAPKSIFKSRNYILQCALFHLWFSNSAQLQRNKTDGDEFVLKTLAHCDGHYFSDYCMQENDLRIETRRQRIEFNHSECAAQSPTPAKIVRG
ncbi:10351_t:CDS:2 [Funneliformis mosseae]|uniref:10351_t:CDS:1 n=1 Tax=Funneliformis mosseae TaxID=27381 RepID=A0A9N9CDC1_FUNMO|nr:10351_t:CDS:2 [Funneliformis mosseae]